MIGVSRLENHANEYAPMYTQCKSIWCTHQLAAASKSKDHRDEHRQVHGKPNTQWWKEVSVRYSWTGKGLLQPRKQHRQDKSWCLTHGGGGSPPSATREHSCRLIMVAVMRRVEENLKGYRLKRKQNKTTPTTHAVFGVLYLRSQESHFKNKKKLP